MGVHALVVKEAMDRGSALENIVCLLDCVVRWWIKAPAAKKTK